MCHHTREPTVLSRLICRSFHLNVDRFHQAAWLFLLCVSLEVSATPTRWHHGRMLIHPSLPACATPSYKGVCTHASSGPLRVRRRLLTACLGGPHSLATVVGLLDVVKVFLLIMCIDAPESTTNSLSSSLRVDAGKHLFSEGEKNVALFFSFNVKIF